jgi:hypothetical protein
MGCNRHGVAAVLRAVDFAERVWQPWVGGVWQPWVSGVAQPAFKKPR